MKCTKAKKKFRSQEWFDNPNNPGMTALYIERYQNQEFTREEVAIRSSNHWYRSNWFRFNSL